MSKLRRLTLLFLLFAVAVAAGGLEQHAEPAAQQPATGHTPAAEPTTAAEHAAPGGEHQPESGLLQGVFKWVNFLAFFGLLGYLLRQPIKEFLAGRARAIQEGLESGRRARREAAQRLQEVESRLERLEAEIAELRAAAGSEGKEETARLRGAARAETERILASAEQDIRALAKAARGELKSYVAGLAAELAEERIRARLTPERQKALLREYADSLRDKQG